MADLLDDMRAMCAKFGLAFVETSPDVIVGVADSVQSGVWPLNGLRHERDQTSGWFLWGGEGGPGADADFFKPTHALHLIDRCPEVMAYLGLPPGWRFRIAPGWEDVWEGPPLRDDRV